MCKFKEKDDNFEEILKIYAQKTPGDWEKDWESEKQRIKKLKEAENKEQK